MLNFLKFNCQKIKDLKLNIVCNQTKSKLFLMSKNKNYLVALIKQFINNINFKQKNYAGRK